MLELEVIAIVKYLSWIVVFALLQNSDISQLKEQLLNDLPSSTSRERRPPESTSNTIRRSGTKKRSAPQPPAKWVISHRCVMWTGYPQWLFICCLFCLWQRLFCGQQSTPRPAQHGHARRQWTAEPLAHQGSLSAGGGGTQHSPHRLETPSHCSGLCQCSVYCTGKLSSPGLLKS